MLTILKGATAALAAVVALSVGTATPAAAGPAAERTRAGNADVSILEDGGVGDGFANCPSGWFCVWPATDATLFDGYGWTSSDSDWRNNYFRQLGGTPVPVADNDGSWYNHGTPCGGCDHVRVFDGINYSVARTICLGPGQAVGSNPGAYHRGASHSWYGRC